ncbi:MAG TPA: Uma2 family endonuclease [Gemmataceae bacterium]|jgi:Uma2 family endonuclease|nr:Uma2 family endonuclease [Gemmataceae bacterium]
MSTIAVEPVTYGHDASVARFSVARYQRMIETGILTPDDKVELLENYVVIKMPRNPRHDYAIQRLLEILFPLRPSNWSLRVQSAILLSDSQPEPDLAFVRGSATAYENNHPDAKDVGLVIEVADSSLLRDQRDKARIYARGIIPFYWIVNLVDRRIEVHSEPSGPTDFPAYNSMEIVLADREVPLVLDEKIQATIALKDLFG